MTSENIEKRVEDITKEILSWNLGKKSKPIEELIELTNITKKQFSIDIIDNRDFCFNCASKLLAEKTLDLSEMVSFLQNIRSIDKYENKILSLCNELYFLTHILNYIEYNNFTFLQNHVKNFIKIRFQQVEDKNLIIKMENLYMFNLAVNSMLSEIVKKVLDFFVNRVYSLFGDSERRQKIICFLFDLVTPFTMDKTIIHYDDIKMIQVIMYKYVTRESKDIQLIDPVTIDYKYTD